MTNLRNKKYILVIAMALCLVMAFSSFAFADSEITAGGVSGTVDITGVVGFFIDGVFFVDWFPSTSNQILLYRNGFAYSNADEWFELNIYLRDGFGTAAYVEETITGIDDLFNSFYFNHRGENATSESQRIKLAYLNQFENKVIKYYWNITDNNILCDLRGRPVIYVVGELPPPAELSNIPVQAAGNNILNEDNRKYYYDNSSNDTEIYEGDTITYEGDTIINEGDTITTKYYDYGDTIEGDFIDINGGTLNMPTGDVYDIEDFVYNEDNHTYYYSTTNNNQTYNFSVQYFYEYTYVIYLGASEEYKPEAYKFYYELPDGRSSADLTADELSGMSIEFNDVVTYDRVPSNEYVKALFHLDGDYDNDTSFDSLFYFTNGASISYIEDAGFGGALYLPGISGNRGYQIALIDESKTPYSSMNSTSYMTPPAPYNSNYVGSIPIHDSNAKFSLDFRFYSYAEQNDYDNEFLYLALDSATGNLGGVGSPSTQAFLRFAGNHMYTGYQGDVGSNLNIPFSTGVWNHVLMNFYIDYYSDYGNLVYADIYLNGVFCGRHPLYLYPSSTRYLRGIRFLSNNASVPYMIDEIRVTSSNVPNLVSPVPYEDNLVWVLPDSDDLMPNTLAIQAEELSGQYRVGGIRPSMVEKGHVWFQIENNRIISCQVYNGIMWEQVNCYVWTGSRWIPGNYFDVVTLTDYYDIADNTGLPTITTSEGFFGWFQREFKEFKDAAINFFEAWENGGSGGDNITNNSTTIIAPSLTVNGTIDATISQDNNYEFDLGTDAGDLIQNGFDGVSGVFRGAWGLLGGFVAGIAVNVTNFFDFYDTNGLYNNSINGGDNIWD